MLHVDYPVFVIDITNEIIVMSFDGVVDMVRESELTPIEMSQEWVDKFTFKLGYQYDLSFLRSRCTIIHSREVITTIKYVHQYQNFWLGIGKINELKLDMKMKLQSLNIC